MANVCSSCSGIIVTSELRNYTKTTKLCALRFWALMRFDGATTIFSDFLNFYSTFLLLLFDQKNSIFIHWKMLSIAVCIQARHLELYYRSDVQKIKYSLSNFEHAASASGDSERNFICRCSRSCIVLCAMVLYCD